MSRVFVKPGGPDRKVMMPGRVVRFVPEAGVEMELTRYVQRAIDRGDLVAAAPAAPTAAPAAKKE